MNDESEQAGGDDKRRDEEIEWGEGNPRVLFMMNLVLSTMFIAVVVYGLSYIDFAAFSVVNVVPAALVFTAVTCLVTSWDRGMGH